MFRIDHCVICGNRKIIKVKANFADFIVYYLFNGMRPKCNTIYCPECGYRGSDMRFDDDELNRLYWDYRGAYYNHVRCYLDRDYPAILDTDQEVEFRKNYMRKFFRGLIDYSQIRTVLDYGGHKGQYILEEFANADCRVYDISKHNKVDVEAIDKVDFIMICHVLEHVSCPERLLKHIRTMCKENTILYVEVPLCDHWKDGGSICEHINFFNIECLKKLLNYNGFVVTKIATTNSRFPGNHIINCCATPLK